MTDSPKISSKIDAVIVAAGQGERAGLNVPKQFADVGGRPMLWHSVHRFTNHASIANIWVVIGEGQHDQVREILSEIDAFNLVLGGETRQQSVRNGLAAIIDNGGADQVLIHDAARPFVPACIIDRLIDALRAQKAAVPILPTIDTTIGINGGLAGETVDRNRLWRVQTPQAFDFEALVEAHQHANLNEDATDDAQLIKACGYDVAVVEGDERLRKFTTGQDFSNASSNVMTQIRTGSGFDVHRLAPGEELWLGGLQIDHDKGLAGHSDADVVLHALTDALLGAIAAGDIGDHFPPSDDRWRAAPSKMFVEHAVSLIRQKGGVVHNVDMTVICEEPKIKPHRAAMREEMASMLEISIDRISLKATTTEGLGFAGRREGIAAQAIVTVAME